MARSRIIATNEYCSWQSKTKRKTQLTQQFNFGSISAGTLMLGFVICSAVLYIFFVNGSAVKGQEIKKIEKEIGELKSENEKLRIKEAELKSLYYIEESVKELDMEGVKNVSYAEEVGPFALK